MLAKLIKYDLKSSAKIFLLFHLAFLIACVIGRIFFMDRLDFVRGDEESLYIPLTIIICLVSILIVTVNLCSWLMVAFRFYRNLFSREGYLSWTLPVSGIRHLWAKILSGCMLMWIDTLVVALGILILVTGRNVTDGYRLIAGEMTTALGMTMSSFALTLFILSLVSAVNSVITTYFCICIGQLFPAHRVLCAVASYFILSFVVQIVTFIFMAVFGLFDYTIMTTGTLADHMYDIMVPTSLFGVLITVAEYIVTHHIIKKKINLI